MHISAYRVCGPGGWRQELGIWALRGSSLLRLAGWRLNLNSGAYRVHIGAYRCI